MAAQVSVVFRWGSHSYEGSTAIAVVRAIEREEAEYPNREGRVREFLQWSLDRLEAQIPTRELFVDVQVSDETLALSYLLLLEQYGLGALEGDSESPPEAENREHFSFHSQRKA